MGQFQSNTIVGITVLFLHVPLSQAYQQFASIVYRMRREILTLHARASLQEETIARLQRGEWSVDEEQAELKRRIGDLREAIDALKEGDAPGEFVTIGRKSKKLPMSVFVLQNLA